MATAQLATEATKRLTDWIVAAHVKAGDRLPSERSLARTLDVSLYALNRAMALCIAEGRVERQGYKNFLAGAVRVPVRPACHLVVSRRSEYLAAYRRIARDRQIDLTVHTWESTEEAAALLYQLDRSGVGGVICDPPSAPGQESWVPAARQLAKHGIPVVSNSRVGDELSSITGSVEHGIELGVKHLTGLGHQELALVCEDDSAVRACWRRCCADNQRESSNDRIRHDFSWLSSRSDVDALSDVLAGEWRAVTGLVVRISHRSELQRLLGELARKGRRVPDGLSIFAVGNAPSLQTVQPRITSASIDMTLWIEMTFDLLQREMRMIERVGVLPPPAVLQVMPRLQLRESTAARAGVARPVADTVGSEPVTPAGVRESLADLEQAIRRPYSLAAKASLAERPRFASVDLRPFANRPLRFRRGWLGDLPLLSLPSGKREIHGVPFEILGGSKRTDMGAVVFRSAINQTGNARTLPGKLCIPIGVHVEAVYILHGCGYAKPLEPFARYTFHGAKGPLGTVPLVGLGRQKNDEHLAETAAAANANIQDWWSDFPHVDFPHSRMVPLLDDGDGPVKRHVFLYTLEWINPFPKRLVTHLEITADPTVPTTLGMLAVTIVKPRKG
ncbi:substrate-binding domain-containing protein [Rariglobus hedericola]|uniref:GntR family transcriptional regulator n=1 Tax=Rariglobus hedericola TaxID=2597822 RepID=A0A556QRM3_9BACT|nr:substrate-binding domain-containing protein [Rariglobus hedericola]TSJ79295.1 GntR family transcriptional regulator [Rariglobus hedericola]